MSGSIERLRRVFACQRAAHDEQPNASLQSRLDRIHRLSATVASSRQRLHEAVQDDFSAHDGRLTDLMEIGPVLQRAAYVSANLETWLAPRDVDLGPEHGSSRGQILHLPKGVMGNIAPWNFPIESALVMCVDMIAAGNRVIVKPSEFAPASAQAVEELISGAFDDSELAVIQGDATFSQEFSEMPWDHLTFTGSPRIGRLVAMAAASRLVPVTLELGGKNPALFTSDGVTDDLIKLFLSFRMLKAGQVCTSPDYILVPDGEMEKWIEKACSVWQEAYPRYVGHKDATSIINHHHYGRLTAYLDEAQARGVRTVSLTGEVPDESCRQIPPTLVVSPPDDLGCMQDEVFGPIIPILSYTSFDEAVARINAGPSPLAGYIATHDADIADDFILRVRCGGAAVNNFGLQGGHVALPFGGFGASGHGCHSAREGVLGYTHTKSVFHGAADSLVHQVLAPPLSELTQIAADGMYADTAGGE